MYCHIAFILCVHTLLKNKNKSLEIDGEVRLTF